jgi:ribosomal protein S12
MIFRTGSILIVGKCNETILMTIYDFIRKILEDEFHSIQMGLIENSLSPSTCFDPDTGIAIQQQTSTPKKPSKSRRKIVILKNIEPFHFDE